MEMELYAQRMRIEVQFRDTKNLALGMGLSQSRSRGQQRLQALLLIAHIAELAKRLIGEASQARQLELQLMSNNITDQGSSTEIYTSPDPLQYIELETLGPLRVMKPKDKIERSNTYTLSRRSKPTPEAEARAVFKR